MALSLLSRKWSLTGRNGYAGDGRQTEAERSAVLTVADSAAPNTLWLRRNNSVAGFTKHKNDHHTVTEVPNNG